MKIGYGVARTEHGSKLRNGRSASVHIPYVSHLNDNTIALETGALMQVIKVEGFKFETHDDETLQHNVNALNTILKAQGGGVEIYSTLIRRNERALPGGVFQPGFSHDLNEEWLQRFKGDDVFVNEFYLSIIRQNPFNSARGLHSFLNSLQSNVYDAEYERSLALELRTLTQIVQTFTTLLSDYGTRLLGLTTGDPTGKYPKAKYSEILSFLSTIINRDNHPFALPRENIGNVLNKTRKTVANRTVISEGLSYLDNSYSAMLSLKSYPEITFSGIMNQLLSLPHELVVTQSFKMRPGDKSRKALKKLKGQLEATNEHDLLIKSVGSAQGELAVGRVAYGHHHCTIMVTKPDVPSLEYAITNIEPIFNDVGLVLVREDSGTEPAYWAQLPGNTPYIARNKTISTKNFAALAAFNNYARGKRLKNFLGDALTVLPTPGKTPYFTNFHDGDAGNGNACIGGQTTTGKTALATFLVSQSMKFGGKRVVLDKDHSWEVYVNAEDGAYIRIEDNVPTNLNPLQMPNTKRNRAFLKRWLILIVEAELHTDLTRGQKARIETAVDAHFTEFEQHERRLKYLRQQVIGDELKAALAPWVEGGVNGWIFDNPTDTLSFDKDITGIDVGWMLDEETIRTPITSYLLYRIEELIDDKTFVCIVLEEGWKLIADPRFKKQVVAWERTIRKKKGMVSTLR